MGIANAKIGLFPSSGGRGGGGIVTVYDTETSEVDIRKAEYWNSDLTDDAGTLRQRTAAEDFVRLQSDTAGTGVYCFLIGSAGRGHPRPLRLNASGRLYFP